MTADPIDPTTPVRDAVRSLDTRLDDMRREQAWRGIEASLAERPAITAPPRTWCLPVFALATLAVILALVVLPKPMRDEPTRSATPPASDSAMTLSAAAGQRTVFEREGVTLTLVGPSAATVKREADVMRVGVTKGLVVADRAPTAPALAVEAGDNRVVSRDARFAVRVEPTMVVLGAGEQAQQIVDRHAIEMGAPPLPEPDRSTPASTAAPSTAAPSTAAPSTAAPSTAAPSTAAPSNVAPSKAPRPRSPASAATSTEAGTSAKSNASASDGERRPPALPGLRLDAAELYQRAEAALALRDPAGARDFLERLLAEYPDDPRVDAARYDLALIARSFGQRARAREHLDALIERGTDENLKAAARRLRPMLSP